MDAKIDYKLPGLGFLLESTNNNEHNGFTVQDYRVYEDHLHGRRLQTIKSGISQFGSWNSVHCKSISYTLKINQSSY